MDGRTLARIVAGLTILGALLRLPGLNSALWFDEIVTLIQSVRPPLLQVVTAFPGNNNHPFYSLLAHLSIGLLGEHAWTLRLPAMVFGVASIPLLYHVGSTLTSRTEALLAAALLTVSYHHVWFSQNARGYTMLLAFTLIGTGLFLRLLERPSRNVALGYGVAVGLGIYTHLTMAAVALAHALIWAWRIARGPAAGRAKDVRAAMLSLGVAGVISGLLYLPMAGEVYAFFSAPRRAAAQVASSQWAAFEFLSGLQIGFGTIGVLAALTLLAVGGLSYLRRDSQVLFVFALPGVLTAAAVVALHRPMFPRFFFLLLGFGMLVLVRGATVSGQFLQRAGGLVTQRASQLGVGIAALIAAVSLGSLGFIYRYPKQDFASALVFLESRRQASEAVGTAGLAIYPFEHYYRRPWTPLEKREQFDRLRAEGPRAWVIYSFPAYMDRALVEGLREYCPVQQVFPGTLGGGEVMVCATRRGD